MKTNVLYYGDNLEVMPKYVPDDSIDLIYIDPPFFSSRAYEIIYGDIKEKRMFEDRWKGDVYHYVNWMEPRLAQMHRVLKPTGSIYVHLDWHAVHYIKVVMDKIFGYENFRSDLIWCYEGRELSHKHWNRKHDTILFYSKGDKWTFNWRDVLDPLKESSRKALSRYIDENGRPFVLRYKKGGGFAPLNKEGEGTYRQYVPAGVPPRDWFFADYARKKERHGYPTQKPERLLERIITASSSKGDIVADFFCGCGTTLAVAQLLGRKWIGCDVAPTALRLVKQRLIKCGATEIEEVDVPKSVEDLKALEHFEFQNYIVDFIQGVHAPRLVADTGIDGYTTFRRYPVQVKQQEHVGRPEIQKFQSAIHAEKKDKGYFFAFSFTKPAYEEVARCKQEEGIEIELWQVQDLMTADPAPTFL